MSKMWRAEVERILGWRSDDFGHDTHALLEAESSALQRIGEDWLILESERDRYLKELRLLHNLLKDDRIYAEERINTALVWLDASVAPDEDVIAIAERVMETHKEAFKKLAAAEEEEKKK